MLQIKGDSPAAAQHIREALTAYAEMEVKNAVAYCLELLAAIDGSEGRHEEAAQLFGAADKIREDIGTPVEPFNLERYERDVDATRQALGAAAFESQWAEGKALEFSEAVDIAQLDFS